MESLANRVGGSWSAPSGARRLAVVDPATGKPIAEAPLSGADETGRAVDAAARAFPDWRRTTGSPKRPTLRVLDEERGQAA